jgi:hypothetical protein
VRARPTPAASPTLRQKLASLRQDFDAYTAASDTKLASLRQDFAAYSAASETKLASMRQATAANSLQLLLDIVALQQTVDKLHRHMPLLAPTEVTALIEMLWRHQAMVRQASRYTASLKWRETAGIYSQVAALNTAARRHQEAMDAIHLRQYDPDVHNPRAAQQAAYKRTPTAKSRPPTPSRLLRMQHAL